MESNPKKDHNLTPPVAPEPVLDDIRTTTMVDADAENLGEAVEIDPAEFFDPEEFVLRSQKGRFWNDWLP